MGGQTSTITFFFFFFVCVDQKMVQLQRIIETRWRSPRESFSVGGRYREESLSSPLFSFPVAIVH